MTRQRLANVAIILFVIVYALVLLWIARAMAAENVTVREMQ